MKTETKTTLHHMGNFFISSLTKIKFKIWRVTFLKRFLTLKYLGWASGFCAIDDLPCAHWDETEFKLETLLSNIFMHKRVSNAILNLGPSIHWTSNYGAHIVFTGNMLSWLGFQNFVWWSLNAHISIVFQISECCCFFCFFKTQKFSILLLRLKENLTVT